jgi:hypothetical protein
VKSGALNEAVADFRCAIESLVTDCCAHANIEPELGKLANSVLQLRSLNKLPADALELLLSHIQNADAWAGMDREDRLKQTQVSSQLPGCLASMRLFGT